jgi:hypothetical protein
MTLNKQEYIGEMGKEWVKAQLEGKLDITFFYKCINAAMTITATEVLRLAVETFQEEDEEKRDEKYKEFDEQIKQILL